MFKTLYHAVLTLLMIAMPVLPSAADKDLDWGLLEKEWMKKEEIEKFAAKGDVIIPELREAFKSENANKKKNVVEILSRMSGEKSKKEMVEILRTLCTRPISGRKLKDIPEEEYLKLSTLNRFSITGDEGLLAIRESLKGSKGEFRKCLVIGTGFLGDSTYFDSIVEILETDTNPHSRRASAFALGIIGDKKAIPILEKVLLNDDFYHSEHQSEFGSKYPVREAAALALLSIHMKYKEK